MAKKFYAVSLTNGQTGLFNDWNAAKAFIATCPSNAKYKGFGLEADAKAFLGLTDNTAENAETFTAPDGTAIAFVDGSYNETDKTCGWGVVLFDPNRPDMPKQESCGMTNSYIAARNITGEVFAAMHAVDMARRAGYTGLIIYHDYQGIASWATGEWKANQELTQNYAQAMKEAMASMSITFVKVAGHTGVELNERADILAKQGCGVL